MSDAVHGVDPYVECPKIETQSFTIRLLEEKDSEDLFFCYHDEAAVALMNDDNCDFGFYVDSQEKMKETVGYWIDFYKKRYFIRFAVEDKESKKAVGTVEGFDGEVGVLRIDLASAYEKASYLSELLRVAEEHFYEFFQNKRLVIKAVPRATERRRALEQNDWKFIDSFREYGDYYEKIITKDTNE